VNFYWQSFNACWKSNKDENNSPLSKESFMKRVWLLCLLVMMAGCERNHYVDAAKNPAWLKPCPDYAETGKAPVAPNAQCGVLMLKEDPQNPQSPDIPVNVLRLPAVIPVPESDPLFVVAGGPGQSAVTLAETVHQFFNDVRKSRDIIFVDQRGTGKSNAFDCIFETEASAQLPADQQQAFVRKAAEECIAKYRDHFAFYTTPYAVADLDAVREALAYPKINLWGGSYGSRVVLDYVRRYPTHARAGVIDGVAPPDIALPWFMERDGLAALTAINDQCAQTPDCNKRYGNILAKADRVSARLQASPVKVSFPHPRTQGKISMTLAAEDFSAVIHLALYNRDLSALLPQVISDSEAGDYQLFSSLIYLAKSRSDLSGINYAMHYTVVCNEDYPLYQSKNPLESNLFLNAQMVQRYSEICSRWPKATMPDNYWQPVASDVPMLILSGAVDPVTPPLWGQLVQQGLPNAVHLIAPGGHHIVTTEGCMSQLVAQFIAKGEAKSLDAQCVNHIKPLAIHMPPQASDSSRSLSSQSLSSQFSSAESSSAASSSVTGGKL
jgi:pimeloyl-ACP methyl ester carboxylesterase